jgi:hypothetical protein
LKRCGKGETLSLGKGWQCQAVVEASVAKRSPVPMERIEGAILILRGPKVILDKDLAALYGVATGNLNKAVNRNLERFPDDFMLRVTEAEFNDLKFHFGTSRWGGTRKLPRAFTEQGVAMLSSVLRSSRAALVNIEIMRAFVRLRRMLSSHAHLARKLEELEKRYDSQFKLVFDAIRQLMAPPEKARRSIGFRVEEARPRYRVRRLRGASSAR